MKTNWNTSDIPSQQGRLAVITGANSGIGFHTALELARKGAAVVLSARSLAKANDAIARIRAQVPDAVLTPAVLDLASLESVHAFAGSFTEQFAGESIDLLINNAGVMALPQREVTVDGYERQFATNYLGPFALTALLFPHLRNEVGTRIVTVSSGVSNQAKLEFDNLQSEREYKPMFGAYSQSKLANLIFLKELQRKLTGAGSPILSTGGHPGYAKTNLQANQTGLLIRFLSSTLGYFASQDAESGALPTLFAAVSPEVEAGGYYGPNGFQELKGYPVPAKIAPLAKDAALAERLWAETEHLTGVPFAITRAFRP